MTIYWSVYFISLLLPDLSAKQSRLFSLVRECLCVCELNRAELKCLSFPKM